MKIRFFFNCTKMYFVKEMIFVSPCKRAIIKLGIYSAFLVLSFIVFLIIQILVKQNYDIEKRPLSYREDLKYILIWSVFTKKNVKNRNLQNSASRFLNGQSVFIEQGCKFTNCFITYDKQLLKTDSENIDAVVFNVKDITSLASKHFELMRSKHHKYIFHSLQSSERYPVCDPFFDNFFNWTWTYKLDSDIPKPFFNIFDLNNNLVGPKKAMNWTAKMVHNTRFIQKISNKTKAVAWIVNKCNTKLKYQDFVRDLKNELKGYNYSLDIYGTCGDVKCPGFRVANCFKMIENKYFFELIVEDTFAEDYVSEKMLSAMTRLVIPIVLGSSNYKNFLPPGSYINAQAFDMKKLGAIIDYLISNIITYRYFFDWKNHYYYTPRPKFQVCELCEKLNSYKFSNTTMIRNNFRKWWNPNYRNACLQKSFQ